VCCVCKVFGICVVHLRLCSACGVWGVVWCGVCVVWCGVCVCVWCVWVCGCVVFMCVMCHVQCVRGICV